MVKYIDLLKLSEKRKMSKHRLKFCPYLKSCIPVSYYVDKDGAGVCAGLIYKSDNLDCIRLCQFIRDLNTKEIKFLENFMTPDEALNTTNALNQAIKASLDFASSYQNYYKELCQARDNGDKAPSQY
jgi:hypothetical protein